jgi:hypothetical protein
MDDSRPQRVMVTEPDTVALALHETADGYALHLVNYSMNAETKGWSAWLR